MKKINESVQNINQINLRILNYNIFIRPTGIATYFRFNGDAKDERLYKIGALLKKYDIAMFQELFNFNLNFGIAKNRTVEMIKIAKENGLKYYAYYKPTTFSLVDSGLLIVSRYPIVKSQLFPYDSGAGFDKFSEKGVLYAKIKINDHFINVFNTHTQAGNSLEETTIRWKQIRTLIKIINKTVTNNETIIFGGDFNIDAINNISYENNQINISNTYESQNYLKLISLLNRKLNRNVVDCLYHNPNTNIKIPFNKDIPFYKRYHKQFEKQKKYLVKHPITSFGHGEIGVNGKTNIIKHSFECIDYLFMCPSNQPNIKIINSKSKPFFNNSQTCIALSDHYALDVKLQIEAFEDVLTDHKYN